MAAQEIAKGKIIATEGHTLDAIHIIVSGSVKAHFAGGDIVLKKGDIVGLCDISYDSHFFTYTTIEDSSFVSFPFKEKAAITSIVKANPEVGKMMYTSMINQVGLILSTFTKSVGESRELYDKIVEYYEAYLDMSSHNNIISRSLPGFEELERPVISDNIPDWLVGYYSSMKEFPQELRLSLAARIPYLTGMLLRASEDIHCVFNACNDMKDYCEEKVSLLMQDTRLDLFDLYTSLLFKLKPDAPDCDIIKKNLEEMTSFLEFSGLISSSLLKLRVDEYRSKLSNLAASSSESAETATVASADLTNSLDVILDYAGIDAEAANNFKNLLSQFKKVSDKASSEDKIRRLRLELTKAFYHIYIEAFKISVRDFNVPPILKMFFNFGYMDAEYAGIENANFLYSIIKDFRGDSDKGVYTAYEWLTAIYKLQKEPSRNEFDTDYLSYLHEQKVTGKIDEQTEKALANDPGERVLFELNNMFPMVNKVTYGRLSSFCPILGEHDVIKPLQSCLVTVDSVMESYKQLEAIDYGAFYRETIYTNDACGVSKEMINIHILPDIILMPNIGTRGVMWQEIEGKKRTTPSRYVVSVFHMEDLPTTITRLTGEYRWEMCKRVQGARWNDVTDRSLTSEYFDYIQFYRKNSELSQDAKEKIKNSLAKAKNSFKEMFVRDYITWVLFEGQGSPRLNKLARSIMVTYCPFPLDLRQKIGANPLFKELIERYEIKTSQKLHHFDNVIQKMNASNVEVPQELIETRKFIEGSV